MNCLLNKSQLSIRSIEIQKRVERSAQLRAKKEARNRAQQSASFSIPKKCNYTLYCQSAYSAFTLKWEGKIPSGAIMQPTDIKKNQSSNPSTTINNKIHHRHHQQACFILLKNLLYIAMKISLFIRKLDSPDYYRFL